VYKVNIDEEEASEKALEREGSIFLVDKKVWAKYKTGLLWRVDTRRLILIDATERNKEFRRLRAVFLKTLALGARKNITLVAIGGGIIQDIAGFVAATLFRGVPWVLFPSTLLAQADSCIGAKSSVNLGMMKNQIGAFYPPGAIYISTRFLATLSNTDIKSGLGEIAKLSIIDGETRWREFKTDLPALLGRDGQAIRKWIELSLGIKKKYIEEDEFDKGIRNYLNYGHCFGHAIEAATNNRIPHGQAVSLGIILADIVALNRGYISNQRLNEHRSTINEIVDFSLDKISLNEGEIISAMGKDKKRVGSGYAVVVLHEDGHMAKLDDVHRDELIHALHDAKGK
jgi:3-dehydroquinate synthase